MSLHLHLVDDDQPPEEPQAALEYARERYRAALAARIACDRECVAAEVMLAEAVLRAAGIPSPPGRGGE